VPVPDEDCAARSDARVLITASAPGQVEVLVRRVHLASSRAAFPLRRIRAIDLPSEAAALTKTCDGLLDDAAGGTLLIAAVDEMAPIVQARLVDVFEGLERNRAPKVGVRFIFGTTVSLRHRIAAGTFSERLFYRMNVIHLTV
jgi:DNA-binding NtrC family response regulator